MKQYSGLKEAGASVLDMLGEYLVNPFKRKREPIDSAAALERFLETRSTYVAQTSLYGYLRTRTGVRYPELFHDPVFVRSINIAKWHVWLDCLSDLAVYAAGMMAAQAPGRAEEADALVRRLVLAILDRHGTPADSGDGYAAHADRVRARLEALSSRGFADGEAAFTESPGSLTKYAPVVDELKALDDEIVTNSVRFRWHEIRRDIRAALNAAAILT